MPDVEARIPSEQILAHCVGSLEDVEWQTGFPGNYAKLPPPMMMRADAVGMIGDWLVQRLR